MANPGKSRILERVLERFILSSRWILAPFFVALVFGLLGLLIKTLQTVAGFAAHFVDLGESQVILETLSLVDLTLTGSLVVIVIFSGYENFVSKIDADAETSWPDWMSRIDFTGLKLKLMSSIVAISGIQLLRYFLDVGETSDRELAWGVGIHLAFVLSALLLAWTDKLSGKEHGQPGHGPGAAS